MNESSWFRAYTWNGEASVTTVTIELSNSKTSSQIAPGVEKYLASLGFKEIANVTQSHRTKRGTTKQDFDGWIVFMSGKTFKRATSWEMLRFANESKENGELVPSAWPSHLSIHMTEKRGVIAAKKFNV
jgi:hypothetical protein